MGNILVLLVEGILLSFVIILIVLLVSAKRSFDLEKRITRFSISSITDRQASFFDKLYEQYDDFLDKFSKFLTKFKLLVKYSKVYSLYTEKPSDDPIIFISRKFIDAFFAILLTIISDVLRRADINIIQVLAAFIIGFFIPDIFILIKYFQRKKRIENDMFKAVLIMSNAFKSGRSIMQAVKIVSEELDGPISDEFKKMYVDLNYGLDLDVVFQRLSARTNLEETKYIASSLVILNKTGGNVVQVFNSIERNFYERKKLKDELKSVSAASILVFIILVLIPPIIMITISALNRAYFAPLVTTHLGRIILFAIIIIYIIYIFIIIRIMMKSLVREWYYEKQENFKL